jgi:hypothetical protein
MLAILHRVEAARLSLDEAAFSDAAWAMLALREGDQVRVSHAPQLESLAALRGKVYGRELAYAELKALMDDASRGLLSDLHLAAFVTACAGRLCARELVDLTRAMVDAGERLRWPPTSRLRDHARGENQWNNPVTCGSFTEACARPSSEGSGRGCVRLPDLASGPELPSACGRSTGTAAEFMPMSSSL